MAKQTAKEATRVEVEIYGVSYPLKTTDSEEYTKAIAKMVDDKMNQLSTKAGSFLGTRIAVLAAMEFADKYVKLKRDYDELMRLMNEK